MESGQSTSEDLKLDELDDAGIQMIVND